MVPLISLHTLPKLKPPLFNTSFPHLKPSPFHTQPSLRFPIYSLPNNSFQHSTNQNSPSQQQQPSPRTLFPGGYKRAEVKVPTIVLRVDPDEVLSGGDVLDLVDKAVSEWVGIVVLNGVEGSGKSLYDAACLLKNVVRDRAYLMIAERVDIAAAVNASGVVLSDQGLPAIVARNMMIDSNSDSVFLPLVARSVRTPDAALSAAKTEGADFLIYDLDEELHLDSKMVSGFENVKIPVFVVYDSQGDTTLFDRISKLPRPLTSGFVLTLEGLRSFSDNAFGQMFDIVCSAKHQSLSESKFVNDSQLLNGEDGAKRVAGFVKLEDKEKFLIEKERSVLLEAIAVIKKAAPMMEEVSLLIDAVSQLDEPFSLAIVGEFNSGKSSVINALLGESYLKEGVVPTTNEITFLRYSNNESREQQCCERHPDGQIICYLPAPILKEMNIVDTPGTNVILQRQQRLTEEFVPRADLLLFVISADRPLTESEVTFLRYIRQWKKRVVFVLNKSDLYQNASELEEAISFIKENTKKLINSENVTVYPVSARSALLAKLSTLSGIGKNREKLTDSKSHSKFSRFDELEKFLYSFLDGSTSTGMERMKLKLETPISIAERLLSACETLVKQELEYSNQDLATTIEIVNSVKEFASKMENESISWRRRTLSLIDTAKSRVVELINSTLKLSNLDLVTSYVFRGNSTTMPATVRLQNDIIGPALSDTQRVLGEYVTWLQSKNAHQGKLYRESFERRWPSVINQNTLTVLETYELLRKVDDLGLKAVENFSSNASSKLFEQEIREVFLGTFGGLGAAGFSASLLTSVLPSTLEDLLALGLCSAGGYVAILNFPSRRQEVINKVSKVADGLAREVEEGMQGDLRETLENLEKFVTTIGKPYQDAAQHRLDELVNVQEELSSIATKIKTLQVEIQNLHVS